MTIQWTVPPSDSINRSLEAYKRSIVLMVVGVMKYRAPQAQNWMRRNALWTDRTGNARRGLHAEADAVGTRKIVMTLAHGVDYGIWLEIANAGAYAIIAPAVDHWGPIILDDVQQMLR